MAVLIVFQTQNWKEEEKSNGNARAECLHIQGEKRSFNLNANADSKEFLLGGSLLLLQQHNLCSAYFDDLLKKIGERESLFV